jgi:hypothetical protein
MVTGTALIGWRKLNQEYAANRTLDAPPQRLCPEQTLSHAVRRSPFCHPVRTPFMLRSLTLNLTAASLRAL